jgi:hypothetical protein
MDQKIYSDGFRGISTTLRSRYLLPKKGSQIDHRIARLLSQDEIDMNKIKENIQREADIVKRIDEQRVRRYRGEQLRLDKEMEDRE